MEKVKVAVIGVGHLGRFHAFKFAELEEAELVALVDVNENQLKKVAHELKERYQLTPQLLTTYKDASDLVQAVSIATPTYTHYEIASYFLRQGKAVFLEKPISSSLKEAETLVKLAKENRAPLQVGYIERFHPGIKELLTTVQKPVFIEAHRLSPFPYRNLDIDVVLDLMIHDLDLVLCLNKNTKVKMLHAVGAPVFSELPDIVNARLVFENGVTCNLTASRISTRRERRFRVFEKGAYHLVDTLNHSYTCLKVKKQEIDYDHIEKTYDGVDPLKSELKSFLKSILSNTSPLVTGEEALESLRLAFLIKQDVENNLKYLYE